MNQQSLAVLLSGVMLGVFLFAVVAIIAYSMQAGRIRRSPLATRREKNMRHLMTISTLGIAVACTAVFMMIDPRIGVYCVLSTALFALFIAPIRTVIIEMGLRRTKMTPTDAAPTSSIDVN